MTTRFTFGGDEHLFVECSEEMSLESFFKSLSMAKGVRARARNEPSLGAVAGSPPASSIATWPSSFISSASARPTRAPRASRLVRIASRPGEQASISGDQWS